MLWPLSAGQNLPMSWAKFWKARLLECPEKGYRVISGVCLYLSLGGLPNYSQKLFLGGVLAGNLVRTRQG